ncbi:hypothetical protein [Glycomyces halotolerans]
MSGRQSADASAEGVKAGARARIPQPDTRQSVPAAEAADRPEASGAAASGEAGDEVPATFKDAVGASLRAMEPAARRWARLLRPPLFWTEGLPAAGESWAYAKDGEWCRPDSPVRAAALAWQVATFPVRAAAFYATWLLERPSRALVFVTVYALLASTSYASWLPWLW